MKEQCQLQQLQQQPQQQGAMLLLEE